MTTVLNFCATDFDNPLSREWALMAIRNACEGHSPTQEFISGLQPQGVIEDEMMRRMGLSVEVDPSSGRFKINYSRK